jgi:hypothetical protein
MKREPIVLLLALLLGSLAQASQWVSVAPKGVKPVLQPLTGQCHTDVIYTLRQVKHLPDAEKIAIVAAREGISASDLRIGTMDAATAGPMNFLSRGDVPGWCRKEESLIYVRQPVYVETSYKMADSSHYVVKSRKWYRVLAAAKCVNRYPSHGYRDEYSLPVPIKTTTVKIEVPGPERIIQVPGPERIVKVPCPSRRQPLAWDGGYHSQGSIRSRDVNASGFVSRYTASRSKKIVRKKKGPNPYDDLDVPGDDVDNPPNDDSSRPRGDGSEIPLPEKKGKG